MTHVVATMQRFDLEEKTSLDEMMAIAGERSAKTVCMKNKPIGVGFKFWAVAQADYVPDFFPHSNRGTLEAHIISQW